MKKITVITADIINSRKFDFEYLQNKLVKYENELILSPFELLRGDEIQCVLDGWLKGPEIVRNLRNLCRPMKLRIGIGLGFIEEDLIKRISWKMNGKPFHLARLALEGTGKGKDSITAIKTGKENIDHLINSIWLLMDTIEKRWTDEQWDAVHIYEKVGTYVEASKVLVKSPQAVQKLCKRANWGQIRQAENSMQKVEEFMDEN